MPANLVTRRIESPAATEMYVSGVPVANVPPQEQAQQIFSHISEILRAKRACILQERVFATQSAMKIVSKVRSEAYAGTGIDDGVAPSFLICKQGLCGALAGVQVHALIADNRPDTIDLERKLCGRIARVPGRTYLVLSGVSAPEFKGAAKQARAMLLKGESALKQFDANFRSVVRTWMWLGDILSWYDDFNQARNKFFSERGMIGKSAISSLPASTGIGLAPADGGMCSMDLAAVLEPVDSMQYLPAVGRQHCALEYGSAFSRACRAAKPAGETVFVSGTASIDASGATTNIGNAQGQIRTTIENVRAVLRDMCCADQDVVQVVAYCRATEVEKIFNDLKGAFHWPWVTVVCDICRPDLLFEVEATAKKVIHA